MDQRQVFHCYCGDYHYLDVSIFHDDDDPDDWKLYSFGIVESPPTFWHRLWFAFKRQDNWREVQLTPKQLLELAEMLQRELQHEL